MLSFKNLDSFTQEMYTRFEINQYSYFQDYLARDIENEKLKYSVKGYTTHWSTHFVGLTEGFQELFSKVYKIKFENQLMFLPTFPKKLKTATFPFQFF